MEARLLDFVSKSKGTSVLDIAKSLHLSRAFTESTVVTLCSLDVLKLDYVDGEWRIVASSVKP